MDDINATNFEHLYYTIEKVAYRSGLEDGKYKSARSFIKENQLVINGNAPIRIYEYSNTIGLDSPNILTSSNVMFEHELLLDPEIRKYERNYVSV